MLVGYTQSLNWTWVLSGRAVGQRHTRRGASKLTVYVAGDSAQALVSLLVWMQVLQYQPGDIPESHRSPLEVAEDCLCVYVG